jgi:YidC/Oxa1 family membrane protein insertase
MAGCLPLLIQLPIIMVLYQIVVDPLRHVVGLSADVISGITQYVTAAVESGGLGLAFNSSRGSIELINVITEQGIDAFRGLVDFGGFSGVTASGADIFAALEAAVAAGLPDFHFAGLNLALTPSFTANQWLLIIPALTFVVYFFSNKLIRKLSFQPQMAANDQQQGCSNAMMDYMMPLMSVYFTFLLPGAIGVYWIFKSVLSTLKQFVLSKFMPFPKFTEEDIKAAEKEMKAQSKGRRVEGGNRNPSGTKPRSLQHIDDDDYEQPAEPQKPKKAESGMASLVDTPTLKDDEKDEKPEVTSEENAEVTEAETENGSEEAKNED